MKAPEKIYLQEPTKVRTEKKYDNDIEYIRTDTFIEKVKSFLNKKDDSDYYTIGYIKRHLKYIIKEVGL